MNRTDLTETPQHSTDFAALYEVHARPLLQFIGARCRRSEAEDIAQVVWLKVHRVMKSQFRGGHFRAWLFKIARTTLIDHSRRMGNRRIDSVLNLQEAPDSKSQDPARRFLQEERMAAISECRENLNSQERCVFDGRIAGRDYEEITSDCGCDHNAAYKAWNAAKKKLRSCLDRKDV